MLNKKLKKKLHRIALLNNITDELAEKIVMSPFKFQRKKLEEDNIDDKTNFYHKYLGKFYIKESVKEKINKNNKGNGQK